MGGGLEGGENPGGCVGDWFGEVAVPPLSFRTVGEAAF